MLHYDTHNGLSDLNRTVQNTVRALQPHVGDFDSIAVQGTSGIVVGSPVSLLLNKPLVIVREDETMRCHHSRDVENALHAGRRALFLDDQISTGATIGDVEVKLARDTNAEVVASYLYQYGEYRSPASRYSRDTSMWDLFKRGYGGF
jgi:adenine/guanine phosphoribosyltransferase-like PRPP-binding protein